MAVWMVGKKTAEKMTVWKAGKTAEKMAGRGAAAGKSTGERAGKIEGMAGKMTTIGTDKALVAESAVETPLARKSLAGTLSAAEMAFVETVPVETPALATVEVFASRYAVAASNFSGERDWLLPSHSVLTLLHFEYQNHQILSTNHSNSLIPGVPY